MTMPALACRERVLEKTLELCQTLLDSPETADIRNRIQAFLNDEESRKQYENVLVQGRALHEKQDQSLPIPGEEVAAFEADRDALMKNATAYGYITAQGELHHLQESIQKYVTRTLELGRVPDEEDMEECCSGGCSCGH